MPDIIWKGNEHTNSSSRGGIVPVCIVNHISAGTMGSMDNWFTSSGNEVSSAHFGVAKDGRIHQYVKIERMAWANGLRMDNLRAATAPIVFDKKINPNLYSVSIEHEGTDGDLTEEQFQSSVWLHRYIRDYVKQIWGYEIPFDDYHVIGHFQIDKINKPNCPGPKFPWARLYTELTKEEEDMGKVTELEAQVQTCLNTLEAHIKLINEQAEQIKALQARASQPVPEWAKEAVTAALSLNPATGKPLVDTPDGGSYDFYRLLTILHRAGKL